MFARLFFLTAICTIVAAQDAVVVRVTGFANSEDVVEVGTAVANAVAQIEDACKYGGDARAVAETAAKKVVKAAATANAAGGIFIQTTGAGVGQGAVKAEAVSTATAIAEAIATAISQIAGTTDVTAQTQAIKVASQSAAAKIEQAARAQGDAIVIGEAAATATAFVTAVADALAAAAAECKNGQGFSSAATVTTAIESPAPADITDATSNSFVDVLGQGQAEVGVNTAVANVFGNDVPSLASGSAPVDFSRISAGDFLKIIRQRLGLTN